MKKKEIMPIALTTVMIIGMLAGCGDAAGETASDIQKDSAETSASTSEGLPDESESGESGQESLEAKGNPIQLPLTEEPVTLRIWMPRDTNFVYSDYNDGPFFQEMERRTGVHLEFETPVSGEETTAFNLMIASGDLPDIICRPNYYPEGLDAAIDDGYFLDLTPYLDTCLSNYNAARKMYEVWERDTITDSGRIAAVYSFKSRPDDTESGGAWGGLQIRQDWLDDLGLDVPTTYEELEEVLIAFKEEKGAYAPLAMCSHGNYWYGEMSAGFGVIDDFMNENGTVKAGFITDEWREYLTLMNDWYEKGLIDPDFMTNSAWMVDTELVTSGASGVWWSMYTMPPAYKSSDANMEISALPSPKKNPDDTLHFRVPTAYDSIGVAISADCQYPEIALQWIDYLFTEDGALLADYGIEGDTFVYDENGEITYTEKITNDEEGLTVTQALISKTLPYDMLPWIRDMSRESKVMPSDDRVFIEVWSAEDFLDDWMMPGSLMQTGEESKELASLYTDIQTYYREATCQFITGVLDIEGKDWDDYINVIKGMGIDRCVEIKQAALDRYLAR